MSTCPLALLSAPLFAAALAAALTLAPSPATAQAEPTPKTHATTRTGPYLGVQPGMKDLAPGKATVRSKGAIRVVTWVGFQMAGQGGRVFIQSTEPPEYTLVPGEPNQVILELVDTRLHSVNDGRPLDTGWFPTAVARVDARQLKGNRVRITIDLREVVGYDLRQESNYLFLDFRPPVGPITPPVLPSSKAAIN